VIRIVEPRFGSLPDEAGLRNAVEAIPVRDLAVRLRALGRQLHGSRKIALELRLAREVLHGPLDLAVAQRRGRMQRPIGIARCGRASAHRSARPAIRMLLT